MKMTIYLGQDNYSATVEITATFERLTDHDLIDGHRPQLESITPKIVDYILWSDDGNEKLSTEPTEEMARIVTEAAIKEFLEQI